MKKLCLALLLTIGVASHLQAQGPGLAAATAGPAVHQIGLIDMGHVFKNYEKFKALTEGLQGDIEQTDAEAKVLVQKIQQLQSQGRSGNIQEGSADWAKLEGQLVQAQTNLETFKRLAQREFMRKEADIYKTVYLEVEDAVRRYSEYYKYTLVLRFSRQALDEAADPREIVSGMNRQIVHFRAQDDLTDHILEYLNGAWRNQNPARTSAPAANPSGVDPAARPNSLRPAASQPPFSATR